MKTLKHNKKNYFAMAGGFTLLELLVAIAIFSVLSVMAYGGLQTVISTKKSAQQGADRISEVQLFMMRISNDLRQSVPRKIRNEYGDYLYAMQFSKSGEDKMEWSRDGYRNPVRLKRSHVQRVAYKLEQQKLIRITWSVLDRAQDTEVIETEVLSNVESIEWRFLNYDNEWVSEWPETGGKASLFPLPKALEFNAELKDWGKLRRLILLGANV